MLTGRVFVDGVWREAGEGEQFPVFDPSTEEEIGRAADATVDDALEAVECAARAQVEWAARPPRARAEVLDRAARALAARDDLADLVVRENGKPRAEAVGEVRYAADFVRWYGEEAVRVSGTVASATAFDARMVVLQQPIGVALQVTPWNLPLAMITRKAAPALAAGCSVVLKPAPETPLSALAIAEVFADAGIPPGVLNVLPTTRAPEVVAACLDHHAVRKLSFTGSTEVGKLLLRRAADRVVSCSMELGGNAPFVVLEDADVDTAVEAALVAKMRHNAEACTAANRFVVHAAVAPSFGKALSEAMADLTVGNGFEPGVQVGPLISDDALDRVEALVGAATAAGAVARTGGSRRGGRGWFYSPTVLEGVEPGNPILADEIFGPVAPIVTFEHDEEALAIANDTEYGLLSYVFSRDLGRALRFAEGLEVGMVAVNRAVVSDAAAPFGGVKQSGLGREGGPDGIHEYLEKKYISVAW